MIRAGYEWNGATGASLVTLVGDASVALDREGVSAAFGEIEPTGVTCIEGARRVPIEAPPRRRETHSLGPLLEGACARLGGQDVALALSGGVDSAVLAMILGRRAVAYTLAPALDDYNEESAALAVARRAGIEIRFVRVDEEDFVAALPDVVRACESPLYNLHPVGRHLLARAVRADGFDVLVTGDGADEVFRGTSGADYLPVVDSLARAAGVVQLTPFLDPATRVFTGIDPTKRALRELALALGVPDEIARAPKHPRFAPAMDIGRYWDASRMDALARSIGRAPSRKTDRERVAWTTLGLFSRLFPGFARSCAA